MIDGDVPIQLRKIFMKKELWIRLRRYRFENLVPVTLVGRIMGAFGEHDAFTRAFAAKIARKHGWTNEFAFLAIREYKKFVYLGTVSHYDVTPSKIIDQVWHEHQLFTRGYREFCQDVLGKHFDHSPELLAFDDQSELWSAQYQKTLAFYEHEFGVTPPQEIWGKTKFDPATIKGRVEKPKKKQSDTSGASSDEDIPLFTMFSNSGPEATYAPVPVTFTSGKGGEFGGAGAGGSWGDTATPEADAGSASTSSCSSSSSCGGGGCGGGD